MNQDQALLSAAFCGNQDAVNLAYAVCRAADAWDGVIDADAKATPAAVNAGFMALVADVPSNPFYLRYMGVIAPCLLQHSLSWLVANELEKTAGESRVIAHVLRHSVCDIFTVFAYLLGGAEHAVKYGARIRMMVQHDSLDEFSAEMAQKYDRSALRNVG